MRQWLCCSRCLQNVSLSEPKRALNEKEMHIEKWSVPNRVYLNNIFYIIEKTLLNAFYCRRKLPIHNIHILLSEIAENLNSRAIIALISSSILLSSSIKRDILLFAPKSVKPSRDKISKERSSNRGKVKGSFGEVVTGKQYNKRILENGSLSLTATIHPRSDELCSYIKSGAHQFCRSAPIRQLKVRYCLATIRLELITRESPIKGSNMGQFPRRRANIREIHALISAGKKRAKRIRFCNENIDILRCTQTCL